MEISPKLVPLYVLILAVGHMVMAMYNIRRYAATKDTHFRDHHREGMKWSMLWLFMTVLTIVMVRYSIKPSEYQNIFWIHLPLVLAAAGIFVAIFVRFDGIRAPQAHPSLGYTGIVSFVLGMGIGLYMLVQM